MGFTICPDCNNNGVRTGEVCEECQANTSAERNQTSIADAIRRFGNVRMIKFAIPYGTVIAYLNEYKDGVNLGALRLMLAAMDDYVREVAVFDTAGAYDYVAVDAILPYLRWLAIPITTVPERASMDIPF